MKERCGRTNEYDEETGRTALHKAAQRLDIECIKSLLNFGADPNLSDLKVFQRFRFFGYTNSIKIIFEKSVILFELV